MNKQSHLSLVGSTGQNSEKNQTQPQDLKTLLASQECATFYDSGEALMLLSNEDQSGVVYNAAYGHMLKEYDDEQM